MPAGTPNPIAVAAALVGMVPTGEPVNVDVYRVGPAVLLSVSGAVPTMLSPEDARTIADALTLAAGRAES